MYHKRGEYREDLTASTALSLFCIGSSFPEVPEPTLSQLRCFLKDCSINRISSSLSAFERLAFLHLLGSLLYNLFGF